MRNFVLERKMYETAKALIEKRYPTGWGGKTAKTVYKGRLLCEFGNGGFQSKKGKSKAHACGQ